MDNKVLALAVVGAAAVAGAVALDINKPPTMSDATGPGREQCYGVAKAGENGCANDSHTCGGLAAVNSSGQDWMLVEAGTCLKMGGQLTAFADPKPAPAKDGTTGG